MSTPRLDARIPEQGFPSTDAALDAFLAWVADRGVRLYPHQEEAIVSLFTGSHVVLDAPTGSGKTLVATALVFKTFVELGHAWYTAPIKALVNEKFLELCSLFGAEHVGMITGDGAVNRDAPILACTTEVLANLAAREGSAAPVNAVVLDEFHYYGDRDRGAAWQIPLLTLPQAQFLLLSGTLGDTTAIRADLAARTGREVVEVRGVVRPVPLRFAYSTRPELDAIADLWRNGRAPVYVVHFAQSDATEKAGTLMSTNWCTREEKAALADAIRGVRFSSPFGPTLKRYLLHGVGVHHAGLLPRYRLLVEQLAQRGLLKVICGTDTLGVGINVPIRSVLFTKLCKFDGEKTDILTVRDFQQIAGRAGRAGFDTEGDVVVQAPAHVIENLKIDQEPDPKRRKRMVKAKPPDKGYKHWDEETYRRLVDGRPEALVSRMSVDHGRLLAMMQHAEATSGDALDGVERLRALVHQSHATAAEKTAMEARVEVLVESLRTAGVLGHDGNRLTLDPELQRDFSLHHALSLFLVHALRGLDKDAESYPLDVLAWVEAILENPMPILRVQENRARKQKLDELRAAGVEFEERVAAIQNITWPKPNADLIYEVFNAYARTHPWVEGQGVRPKGIVREILEQFLGFNDAVRELELIRSEGALLRYVGEVYKALVQNVPAEQRTPAFDEMIANLRATLAVADTSLLAEWERMRTGAAPGEEPERPVDLTEDRRAFTTRLRAELHALVRALARGDWEEAAACVRHRDDDAWDAAAFERALAPFVEAHGGVAFDHRARLGHTTTITPAGRHTFTVRQVLLPAKVTAGPDTWGYDDPDDSGEAEESWSIEGVVDLRDDTNPQGPLLQVLRVG
jgi:hypothetical protein